MHKRITLEEAFALMQVGADPERMFRASDEEWHSLQQNYCGPMGICSFRASYSRGVDFRIEVE